MPRFKCEGKVTTTYDVVVEVEAADEDSANEILDNALHHDISTKRDIEIVEREDPWQEELCECDPVELVEEDEDE